MRTGLGIALAGIWLGIWHYAGRTETTGYAILLPCFVGLLLTATMIVLDMFAYSGRITAAKTFGKGVKVDD